MYKKTGTEAGRILPDARITSIVFGFEGAFWKGNCYTSVEGLCDERANAMAVLSGLAGNEHSFEFCNVLIPTMNRMPYFSTGFYLYCERCVTRSHVSDDYSYTVGYTARIQHSGKIFIFYVQEIILGAEAH